MMMMMIVYFIMIFMVVVVVIGIGTEMSMMIMIMSMGLVVEGGGVTGIIMDDMEGDGKMTMMNIMDQGGGIAIMEVGGGMMTVV